MISVQVQVPLVAATAVAPGEARDPGSADGSATTEGAAFADLFAGLLPAQPGVALTVPGGMEAQSPATEPGREPPAALPDPALDVAVAIEHALAVAVAVAPTSIAPPGAARSTDGTEPRRGLEPSRAGTPPLSGNAKAGWDGANSDAAGTATPAIAREPVVAVPGAEAGTRTVPPVADPQVNSPQSAESAPAPRLAEVPVQPGPRTTPAAAPETLSTLRIESPMGTQRWRDELSGSVSILVRNATSEAEIRVTPAELGPVHARISIEGGTASVFFSAPTQEARDALEGALDALRERLAESGLTLAESGVSGEPASRAANQDDREAPEGRGGALAEGATPSASSTPGRRHDGLIDLYA